MKCTAPQQRRHGRKTHEWRRWSPIGNPCLWQQRSKANQGARSNLRCGQEGEECAKVMATDDRRGPEVLCRHEHIFAIVLQLNPADFLYRSTAWPTAQVQCPTLPAALRQCAGHLLPDPASGPQSVEEEKRSSELVALRYAHFYAKRGESSFHVEKREKALIGPFL